RSLTRYEFAAALNAALDVVNAQIAQGEQPSLEDLQAIERLNIDFQSELASLNLRGDRLEAQTAQLEGQQFSTTAFLNGQTILSLAFGEGGDPPGSGEGNVVLTHLTLLQIAASFHGNDVLRVGLEAGNFRDRGFASPNGFNTNMALL
ncbi:S-layer protein, partial [Corallococcus praedator]